MPLHKLPFLLLTTVAVLFGTSRQINAQSLGDVQIPQTPLVLKAQGSFFVGGEKIEQTQGELGNLGPGGHITINQMYVRYMVPQGGDGNLPVVMIHGATLTGKTWETTPDGRMGWDEYFVRNGHPVYVPDQVGRGRSGFNQATYNNVRAGSIAPAQQAEWLRFSDEGAWPNFRFGPKPGVPFQDSQFPLTAVDELAKQAVPDMNRGLPTPTPTIKALSDLSARLKGAVLISHSQSGSFPLEAALLNPSVTKALILVEPGSCPAYTDDQVKTLAPVPLLIVFGDHRDNPTGLPTLPTWQERFDRCQSLISRLQSAGGQAQMLDPPSRGIRGNSHMLMQDKNSLQLADLILRWLDERVGKRREGKKALSDRQASIVTVAAFTASGDLAKLQVALNEALDAGLTINEIKEVLVQMYAYAGFPRSLNGINAFNEVVKQRQQQGRKDSEGRGPGSLPTDKSRLQLGGEIRTRLTRSTAVGEYTTFVPVIDEFLRAHLFGDIFGRDNLDYQSREIATIAALATLTGVEPQLKSHFNVGMNVGLTGAQLKDIVRVIDTRVDRDRAADAARVLGEALRTRPAAEKVTATQAGSATTGANAAALGVLRAGAESPQRASPANFTGEVTIESSFKREAPSRIGGARVTFAPGARTAWHMHPLGQILIVTSGTGWVQREGGPKQDIHEDDIVWTPPGVRHWHGASIDSAMSHVAIAEMLEDSQVTWMEQVSDQDYRR